MINKIIVILIGINKKYESIQKNPKSPNNISIRYNTPFVLGVPVRGFLATARLKATANALNVASAM